MLKNLLLILVALLLWQCQEDARFTPPMVETTSEGIPFKQEFNLQEGEQVLLSGGEAPKKLHLALRQLTDSRCPANAMCIHYGSATVLLSAYNSQGKVDAIELCIGACQTNAPRNSHTITTKVGQTEYQITLKDVRPYPGLEKPGNVKHAVLVVEKL